MKNTIFNTLASWSNLRHKKSRNYSGFRSFQFGFIRMTEYSYTEKPKSRSPFVSRKVYYVRSFILPLPFNRMIKHTWEV